MIGSRPIGPAGDGARIEVRVSAGDRPAMENDMCRWNVRKEASAGRVFDFLSCIVDIMDAFDTIREPDPVDPMRLVFVARRVSVPLRKLMLDGNGTLLKSCVAEPRFHPLMRPAEDSQPVEVVQKLKPVTVTAVFEKEGKEATFVAPEAEHRITLHPLFGIRYEADGIFAMGSPFNLTAEPIKFKAWINSELIQLDEIVLKTGDMIRLIANKEGAHIEPGYKVMLPDANTAMMESKNFRYESVNAVKFGGLSYAQLFCMFTALYVVSRSKDMVDKVQEIENETVNRICTRIREYRTAFLARGGFTHESHRLFVVGGDMQPDTSSMGDSYSNTIRIP